MRTLSACAALIAATFVVGPLSAQPTPGRDVTQLPPVSTETVSITHGSSSLNGSINTPSSNGQHGAVVIVAPNDAATTESAKALAKTLARHGLVALTYDASAMNADDARAAIATLRLRGDVDKSRIGVIGIGAGSRVAGEVAQDDKIAYAIAIQTVKDGGAKDADPVAFGKLDKKILLVQAMADPFSKATERYCESVQKKARNLTLWPTSDDDVGDLDANAALLNRISDWAAARAD
jgi:dienelactone hydrolase